MTTDLTFASVISIHAAREGGDDIEDWVNGLMDISIHAAREGGDKVETPETPEEVVISIHAAREGGDVIGDIGEHCEARFQSTPPVKAATEQYALFVDRATISIHAAREGGDANAQKIAQ